MPDSLRFFEDPHQHLLERRTPAWLVMIVNLFVGLLETCYLLWVFLDKVELETFLLLHLGVVLLLSLWLVYCTVTYRTYLTPAVSFIFVLVLGPLGALGSAYAALVHAWFLRDRKPLESLFATLFPDDFGDRSERLYSQLVRMDPNVEVEKGVGPIRHVLAYGSLEQKQAAILLMGQEFVAPFTPLLKSALNDPDPTIASLAAETIQEIEADFAEEARELNQDLRFGLSEEHLLENAVYHDQHAWSGLLPENRTQACREEALAYYLRYLERNPKDVTVLKEVGRLYYRSGRVKEAEAWFDQHRAMGKHSVHFLSWDLEVLYSVGRYEELRQMVAVLTPRLIQQLPTQVRNALTLWGAPAIPLTVPT